MDRCVEVLFNFLVLIPITTVIHELGHIIPVIIFGGEITSIRFGLGNKLFNLGIVEVKWIYFLGGSFHYKNLQNYNKHKKIFIMFSGPLLNLITAIVLLTVIIIFGKSMILSQLTLMSLIYFVVNLIPFAFGKLNTDGKQILDLIIHGNSSYYKDGLKSRDNG